jgi:hypothetical protein
MAEATASDNLLRSEDEEIDKHNDGVERFNEKVERYNKKVSTLSTAITFTVFQIFVTLYIIGTVFKYFMIYIMPNFMQR